MHRHSETEENYLKAIFKLSDGGAMVSTTQLAKDLSTTPASVTDMLKRLSEKALVEYLPYHGVKLMPKGESVALGIVRKHRLWELFLVNVLNFTWDNVHDTAEQLEHVDSPLLIDKIDEFMGYPKFDPHGDPIPSKEGKIEHMNAVPLAECSTGETVSVVGVSEHASDFLKYLDKVGIRLGINIMIEDQIDFDKSIILKIERNTIMLSGEFAKQIKVLKIDS
jgi:DtxR family Mn-dependent transcriptional regulator